MWPLTIFRKRRYERRFRAAVLIFLGVYKFGQLGLAERLDIDHEVDEMFKRIPETPASMRSGMTWDGMGAWRAVAMARLKKPLDGELSWEQLLQPWRRSPFFWFDGRPSRIWMDFRLFEQATIDARSYLRRNDVPVPDIDP